MSRTITSSMSTEISAAALRPFVLFEGDFDTTTLRLWSGYGTLVYSGNNWTGAGNLLGMSLVEETTRTIATGVQLSLAGQSPTLISTALQSCRMGDQGRLWLGCMTGSGTVVADPIPIFAGLQDVPTIESDGQSATITIAYESKLIDLQRPREIRYTDKGQKTAYPTDKGFEFVAGLADKVVVWGGQTSFIQKPGMYLYGNTFVTKDQFSQLISAKPAQTGVIGTAGNASGTIPVYGGTSAAGNGTGTSPVAKASNNLLIQQR